jgi:hypothetical protein
MIVGAGLVPALHRATTLHPGNHKGCPYAGYPYALAIRYRLLLLHR